MKGMWHTLEAILAIVLVMSFLLLFSSSRAKNIEVPDMYEKLAELDRAGVLRQQAQAYDHSSISSEVGIALAHSIEVCDPDRVCRGSKVSGNNIVSASYMIAGYTGYNPREIRLYVSV